LFLLHQGPGKRDWFHSWEFTAWYLGTLLRAFTFNGLLERPYVFRKHHRSARHAAHCACIPTSFGDRTSSCNFFLGVKLNYHRQAIAWIFLVGSAAGTFTTVCFLYVIFRFPKFLDYVKAGGADADVVVRLSTFYELNVSKGYHG
jgi:hypothetical protein